MNGPKPSELKAACADLAKRDVVLQRAYDVVGVPVWRATSPTYETLARAVAYQLISTRAAAAIWGRTVQFLGDDISPEAVLAADEDGLRACGNSRPKIGHMRSIAAALVSGELCFERLGKSEPAAARKELLAVKGIGPWTADLFLMGALGQVDAFPAGDVGIMEAYRNLSGAAARHDTKSFNALAESWRPFRGVAAHLLWGWLNHTRGASAN